MNRAWLMTPAFISDTRMTPAWLENPAAVFPRGRGSLVPSPSPLHGARWEYDFWQS
jgi:hypothetical protein